MTQRPEEDHFDGQISLNDSGSLALGSIFNDYTYHGAVFASYSLYDYGRMVYKCRGKGGTPFDSPHPQKRSHHQYLHECADGIPTLLGKILFFDKDSAKEAD